MIFNINQIKQIRIIRFLYYLFKEYQPILFPIRGRGNFIHNKGINIKSKFNIEGNNNHVFIDKGVVLKCVNIYILGNNHCLHIQRDAFLKGTELWFEDNKCKIIIGERSFIGPSHIAVTEDDSYISIGADVLISSNVEIRSGDSHSIINIQTSKRINFAQSIQIGNHVWIASSAKIMKGVILGDDSIVSAGSIVTKSMPSNVLVGGIPARILKENVTWDKKRIK